MEKLIYNEWGLNEYLAPLGALTAGISRSSAGADRLLRGLDDSLFRDRVILPVNRGRTAIALALAAFKAAEPGKDAVIVPAYICPSVVDTVIACGLRPIAVDVGADLNLDVDETARACTPRILAVIAAHMYGCPAEIARLETLCRARGTFLVDDAAQVIGVCVGGRQLGTFGDAGIVSFSQSKTIVTGAVNSGGLLIVNNRQFGTAMSRAWEALPAGRFRLNDFVRFVWNCWVAESTPNLTRFLSWHLSRFHHERKTNAEKARKMSDATALIALRQLEGLSERIRGRRRVAAFYKQAIGEAGSIAFPQYAEDRYLTRIVLLVPPNSDQMVIRDKLQHEGIQTRSGYEMFVDSEGRSGPNAVEIKRQLLEVPSHSRMTYASVAGVCAALRKAIKETPAVTDESAAKLSVSA